MVRIPKSNGTFRTVYCPNLVEKERLRFLLPDLTKWQERLQSAHVLHGFFAGRSPLTNAMQHRGFRYTLKFDLKDYFDTVKKNDSFEPAEILANTKLSMHGLDECFVEGVARQGLPTSPLLANIAGQWMDIQFLALRGRSGRFVTEFVYTRYADDLCFSFDDARVAGMLRERVPQIVKDAGFVLNEKKTKLQCSAVGRRIITGYAVDDECHPTRHTRRKLRSAKHHRNISQARGLQEFMRLKLPKGYVPPVDVSLTGKPRVASSTSQQSPFKSSVATVKNWVSRKFNLE